MNPPTLAELVREVDISPALLDHKCSDADLVNISKDLDWRTVAPHLGLSRTDIADIDCKRTEPEKRVETLQKWKKTFGFRAKFRALVEILLKTGNVDHAEMVCRLLKQQDEGTNDSRPTRSETLPTEMAKPAVQAKEHSGAAVTLANKPRLVELRMLKTTKGQKVHVIQDLAPKWKDFGIFLDFDSDGRTLNLIEAEQKMNGPVACCQAMFQHWLAGNGVPATWGTLIKLLQDADRPDLAKQIMGMPADTSVTCSPSRDHTVPTAHSVPQAQYRDERSVKHSALPTAGMNTPTLEELLDNISTTEWFRLGLKLGLTSDELEVIESDKKSDSSGALMAVLRKWLRQSDNPTWRAVVGAMRDIGEVKKARDLEDKFC